MVALPEQVDKDEQFDIESFLVTELSKDLLRLATAGSVDDGKSTLIAACCTMRTERMRIN